MTARVTTVFPPRRVPAITGRLQVVGNQFVRRFGDGKIEQ
jgi:hypothetical protein